MPTIEPRDDLTAMTPTEKRAAISLGAIFTVRMLGLFMIMPIFALYADEYEGHSPAMVGLVIGVYGFTQAILQIPFGMLSDRFGRKRVITVGLVIFAIGSAVAASADTITGVIFGRALQGMGAIAAAALALTADLTREEHRTKAMAMIGASIGMAFTIAVIAGPVLAPLIGVSGLFWLTGLLALFGIFVLHAYVPTPTLSRIHRDTGTMPSQLGPILTNLELVRLNAGIFILHCIMTASFVAIPISLRDGFDLSAERHWLVYALVLPVSLLIMVPGVIYADRRNRLRRVFLIAITSLGASHAAMAVGPASIAAFVVMVTVYFAAFNTLEASLPSLVSRLAPADNKGTALGVYSTCQYLGAGIGGTLGGYTLGTHGVEGVYALCAGLATCWVLVSSGMRNPKPLSTQLLRIGSISAAQSAPLTEQLLAVPGVAEAVVIAEDGIAYLKVDRRTLDRAALLQLGAAQAPGAP